MASAFDNTMKRLGSEHVRSDLRLTPTAEMIRGIEQSVKCSLPKEYTSFLEHYSGTGTTHGRLDCTLPDGSAVGLDCFFGFYHPDPGGLGGCYHIPDLIKVYKGRMSDDLVPIADNPGGSKFCICVKGQDWGAVFYWDVESETATRVSPSLAEFLNGLRPHEH